MGMSASQARLIALTARMNDIEYQGQQINQQRTTLSAQVNSLYNSLLEMSVPTPPSTQDYTKVQYTGTHNASTFTIKNVTPKANGKYDLKLGFAQSGNIVSNTNRAATIISTPTEYRANPAADVEEIKRLFQDSHEAPAMGDQYNTAEDIEDAYAAGKASSDPNADNLMIVISKSELKDSLFSDLAVEGIYIDDTSADGKAEPGKHLIKLDKDNKDELLKDYTGNIYIQCNASAVCGSDGKIDYTSTLGQYINSPIEEVDGTQTPAYRGNAYKWSASTWYTPKKEFSDADKSAILAKNLLLQVGDNEVRLLRASDITAGLDINKLHVISESGSELFNNVESKTPTSVKKDDGSIIALYTVADAYKEGIITEEFYSAAVESLQHSFPEIGDVTKEFFVYVDNGELNFIKKTDTVSVTNDQTKYASVYKQTTGTYADIKEYKDSQIEFDNDGRITKIFIEIGGKPVEVKVTAETVTDQEAYEEAFNKYEYEKYKYDQEQHRINVQTSIIQAEDKNLELKLTRLDNERNAVNTEIEAVKKVIDDDIQQSFKTFSG